MACGDARAACRVAILDPELTLTQPPRVTALTGIDALSHALESYVTTRRNPLGLCYSREAWELLSHGFPHVLRDPQDVDARGQMQLGAYFAGLAIETSMLGAAHALANPLTARYGIAHGQAVGVMLPAVIRFNGGQSEVAEWYEELWRDVAGTDLGKQCNGDNPPALLADFVRRMVQLTGLETQLQPLGVEEAALEQLAEGATKQWTGTFNPRPMTAADYRGCYAETFA
jgi:alcohol dehydrogenase